MEPDAALEGDDSPGSLNSMIRPYPAAKAHVAIKAHLKARLRKDEQPSSASTTWSRPETSHIGLKLPTFRAPKRVCFVDMNRDKPSAQRRRLQKIATNNAFRLWAYLSFTLEVLDPPRAHSGLLVSSKTSYEPKRTESPIEKRPLNIS
jgi:hypothetical protein